MKQQASLKREQNDIQEHKEDLIQQKSIVEERLGVAQMDKVAIQHEIEELHKKVEISDQLLLQFSSGAEAPDSNGTLEEWAELETQVGTLTELLQKP
jgi:predicted nuclease with TOPRIM domain